MYESNGMFISLFLPKTETGESFIGWNRRETKFFMIKSLRTALTCSNLLSFDIQFCKGRSIMYYYINFQLLVKPLKNTHLKVIKCFTNTVLSKFAKNTNVLTVKKM